MPRAKKPKKCEHTFPKVAYTGSASNKLMESVYHCTHCPATKAVLTESADNSWIEGAKKFHTIVEIGV